MTMTIGQRIGQGLSGHLRRFRRETRAAVAFETVIVVPLLIWGYIGTFVFFDAYRVYNTSVKTSYMIADMISRQTDPITVFDIQGMANIASSIVRGVGDIEMRVSEIARINGNLEVTWSEGVNGAAELFTNDIPDILSQLPDMPEGERVVLVQTFVDYREPFGIGLTVSEFENFTFVRPRYAGRVPCPECEAS
jgi:hypothetical protein